MDEETLVEEEKVEEVKQHVSNTGSARQPPKALKTASLIKSAGVLPDGTEVCVARQNRRE